ncbi:MAG: hypothetical protein NTW87_24820 [Planctomycetota bacterium]|nr:hypothetical protein [Planctomycetota bacterium]
MRAVPGMVLLFAAALGADGLVRGEERMSEENLRKDFRDPPFLLKSRPLWFWNGPLSRERTRETLAACKQRGYCGVGILPAQNMTPGFMTPEFLDQYQAAVEQAAGLGM